MNFNLNLFFRKERRISTLILLAFLFLLVIALISPKIVSYYENNWDEISTNKIKDIASKVQSDFLHRERKIREASEKLIEEIKIIFTNNNVLIKRLEEIHSILEIFKERYKYEFQLISQNGDVIAWTNQLSENEIKTFILSSNNSFKVLEENFRSYIVFIQRDSLKSGQSFLIVTFDQIKSEYFINNTFLGTYSFEKNLSEESDADIRLLFNDKLKTEEDTLINTVTLFHLDGSKAGIIKIDYPIKPIYIEELKGLFTKIQQILFVVISTLLFFSFLRDLKSSKSLLLKGISTTILLWSLRILFFYLQFPSNILQSDLFDPNYFSSRFAYGIVKSPGELLLTITTLLMNVVYVSMLIRGWLLSQTEQIKLWVKIIFIFFTLCAIILLPLLLRAYGATVRSYLFDSSLKYFEPSSLIPSSPFYLMHINVFFTAVCVTIVSSIFYQLIVFTFRKLIPTLKEFIIYLVSIILLIAIGILYKVILNDEQFSFIFLFYIVLAVGSLAYFFRNDIKVINFNLAVAILIVSSFSAVLMLFDKNGIQEKQLQRKIAYELTKSRAQLTNFLLNETLISLSNDNKLVANFENDFFGENYNFSAYKLWTQSLLSAEGINSIFTLLDKNGKVLGEFGQGIPYTKYFDQDLDTRLVHGQVIFLSREKYPNNLFGITPIFNEKKIVGYVGITLVYDNKIPLPYTTPQIFKSIQLERNPIQLLPEVNVYYYSGNELIKLVGENLPSTRPLPHSIANLKPGYGYTEIWLEEKIEEENYETFYLLYQENNLPRLISVGNKTKSFLWFSYNLFRIAFIHLILVVAGMAIMIAILVAKKYKFRFKFKTKLFAGLVLVTIIPMFFLAYYNRENLISSWNQSIESELKRDLNFLEVTILDILEKKSELEFTRFNSNLFDNIHAKSKIDFDVFENRELLYSSQKKFYEIKFFEPGLSSKAYKELILKDKDYSFDLNSIGNYQYLVGYKKVRVDDNINLIIATPTIYKQERIQKEVAQIDAFIFGTYSLTIILIFIFGNFIFERLSNPIKKLTEATQKVATGDLQVKVETADTSEVGDLVIAFNKMISDLEENRKKLAQAEREYAWKEMAKQVAHEIKNPLTPMKLSLQHLLVLYKDNKKEFAKIFGKVAGTVIEQIEALSRISNEFSHFARMPKRNVKDCDLIEIIKQSINLFSAQAKFEFNYVESEEYIIKGDFEETKRVIINLFKNSVQANAKKIRVVLFSDINYNFLNIEDDGSGIKKEHLERIFEPSFSTKTEGTGLGLSIIKKIITEMSGTIEIESEEGKGTIVKIALPKVKDISISNIE
ncbi:MAG: ATP-binding protein, partial [Ignavibacteria bacterium]|nr:ATP-binding protein [Ignavibacteria bacterium]